jgi:cytochrome P450
MLQDSTVYGPNTDVFNPSRFLNPDGILNKTVKDPDAGWGFGRRVCPGKHFATSTLFLTVARTLYAFDISVYRDPQGKEIRPTVEYTSGLIR